MIGVLLLRIQQEPIQKQASFPQRSRGFTLLELIVVVFIIAVIAGFASLSVGTNADRTVEEEAKRFTALVRLASEESILNAVEMGVKVYKTSYKFGQLGAQGKLSGLEDEDGTFRARVLPAGVILKLEINGEELTLVEASERALKSFSPSAEEEDAEGSRLFRRDDEEEDGAPIIFLLSSGEMTPFVLEFATEERDGFRVEGDFVGNVNFLGRPTE